MAKRRRLTPAQPTYLSSVPAASGQPALRAGIGSPPPIAQVAGETSALAALREVSGTLDAARADGRLLVATYGDGGLRLRRTTPDGAPDVTFGNGGGIVYPPLFGRPQVGYTVAVQDDGKILLGAATTVITQLPLPQTFVYSDVVALSLIHI